MDYRPIVAKSCHPDLRGQHADGLAELEFREGQAIASMRELPVTWDDV
jgi:hypothetical protein